MGQDTFNKMIETAAAEAIFEHLPEDIQAILGTNNGFGDPFTKVDCARSALRRACEDEKVPYIYGALAKEIFAPTLEPVRHYVTYAATSSSGHKLYVLGQDAI